MLKYYNGKSHGSCDEDEALFKTVETRRVRNQGKQAAIRRRNSTQKRPRNKSVNSSPKHDDIVAVQLSDFDICDDFTTSRGTSRSARRNLYASFMSVQTNEGDAI